jgi:N-acetylglucosaminyldiphosphoundecaprenol N-acetyl-beta-D-mannosaminyltransferase
MIAQLESLEYVTQVLPTNVVTFPKLQQGISRISIGNIGIDTFSKSVLLEEVLEHAIHGNNTHLIATVNAQFYVLAEKSVRFRQCIEKAEYICADGMPIVWACKAFAGRHVPRIAGVDLIEDICRQGAPLALRVFFLGGRPEMARRAADILSQRYPGIQVVGVNCPEFGFETDQDALNTVLTEIAHSKPHVLFVGLGAPKQEFFCNEHIRPLKVPIAIGIGGSLEILSGSLPRAPRWMRSSGLEWAFRLSQEPGRLWKRYLIGNVEFLWSVTKWRLHA